MPALHPRALHRAEGRLALLREDVGDSAPLFPLDLVIAVERREAQPLPQRARDGALYSPHEAHEVEVDVACRQHEAPPTKRSPAPMPNAKNSVARPRRRAVLAA